MKTEDKLKIANAIIDIKLVLNAYNNHLNNGSNYTDEDYEPLKKAFDGVSQITQIVKGEEPKKSYYLGENWD